MINFVPARNLNSILNVIYNSKSNSIAEMDDCVFKKFYLLVKESGVFKSVDSQIGAALYITSNYANGGNIGLGKYIQETKDYGGIDRKRMITIPNSAIWNMNPETQVKIVQYFCRGIQQKTLDKYFNLYSQVIMSKKN